VCGVSGCSIDEILISIVETKILETIETIGYQ
jgi:hypothetical protein